jgi:hypothetical protein
MPNEGFRAFSHCETIFKYQSGCFEPAVTCHLSLLTKVDTGAGSYG